MTKHSVAVERIMHYQCANPRCPVGFWSISEGRTEGMMTCPNCNARRPLREKPPADLLEESGPMLKGIKVWTSNQELIGPEDNPAPKEKE